MKKHYPFFRISWIPDTCYYFICKKCKKITKIYDTDIDYLFDKFEKINSRKIALNEVNQTEKYFTVKRLIKGGIFYEGLSALMVAEYFNRKGIDITELSMGNYHL